MVPSRADIEAHRVRDIKSVPRKADGLRFDKSPELGETHVGTEIAGTTKIVTLAGFSQISKTKGGSGPRTSLKNVRISAAVDVRTCGGSSSEQNRPAILLIVGGESIAIDA